MRDADGEILGFSGVVKGLQRRFLFILTKQEKELDRHH